jgi:hypothetical protein
MFTHESFKNIQGNQISHLIHVMHNNLQLALIYVITHILKFYNQLFGLHFVLHY